MSMANTLSDAFETGVDQFVLFDRTSTLHLSQKSHSSWKCWPVVKIRSKKKS